MAREVISTDKAPAAIGPYSQGIWAGGFIFFSGQIPIDPATGVVIEGDIALQTEQVMCNIGALLSAAGVTFKDVVKTTVFLTDLANFSTVNEIYGRFFAEAPPARSTVEVKGLPKGVGIEIEVIALSR
jgi:2-iminobutanoate/2-iminopropanoate deaminase